MTTPTRTRPRPPVDPRIRQRRIEVARRQGRRRLRLLVSLLAVVLTAAGAVAMTRSPVLDVDHVTISGAQHTAVPDIMRAGGLQRHRLMVDVHADAMIGGLKRLPWVDRVNVEREWPATIRIKLTERVPVASLAVDGGGWALVDKTGRVLAHGAAPTAGVPQISGGPAAGRVGTTVPAPLLDALKVAAALPNELRPKAPVIGVAADGIELHLVPSGVVRLGSAAQLAAKLDAVVTVLEHANIAGLSVLDVRVPGAPVLTRR
ncbi:MAG TPA: FtsQ-type POTRA domain-containing protein [Acidimicrobiales bacterium]|nr:FtsQ-type POTRA domain-containing protein [Acidimicrobiales bacterium]